MKFIIDVDCICSVAINFRIILGIVKRYVLQGFADTAATMAAAARWQKGVGVLRHLPGAAVTPLALAAAGAADVLGGVRASLAPRQERDHYHKWRTQTDPENGQSQHAILHHNMPRYTILCQITPHAGNTIGVSYFEEF